MSDVRAICLLIKRSIEFADWAAGEGICPAGYGDPEAESRNPDEFLLAYSQATGDEEWTTLADRITDAVKALSDRATGAEATCADLARTGGGMANILFNLSQDEKISADVRTTMNTQYKAWDGAVAAYHKEPTQKSS